MEKEFLKKPNMITQSDIIAMGWTKKLIEEFLPSPVLKCNPRYKNAAPMKLWPEEDVLSIMEKSDFKGAWEQSLLRKKAVEKSVASKRARLINLANKYANEVSIKELDDEKLVHNAVSNAYNRYRLYNEFGFWTYKDYMRADKETIDRWVVNYIRHKLVDYDDRIRVFEKKTGKDEVYILFRNKLLDRISETYPKYREECDRQKILDCEWKQKP